MVLVKKTTLWTLSLSNSLNGFQLVRDGPPGRTRKVRRDGNITSTRGLVLNLWSNTEKPGS